LTKIVRQRDPAYRKVVELLAAKKPYQAFVQLEKLGEVHQTKSAQALFDRAADDYLQTIANGKSCLVIAPVWSEIEAFTEVVRDKLKSKGLLSNNEQEVMVTSSFGWTSAQRKRVENYKSGYVLQFHRETTVFGKHEAVRMVDVRGDRLVVERDNGDRYAFDPKRIHDFDVGESHNISVASGEKLLIQGNLKAEKIKNGDIVEVADFGDDGSIRLKDGRSLPKSFHQYTHGYATTSHAAQGKTVDHGILILGEAGIRAANLQQAYVSNSRFRERQTIYTTNLEAVKDAMANDSDRKLAHELREKRVSDWRVIENLVAEGDAWRTVRQRVIATRIHNHKRSGRRHAAYY
jgi:ATP-dependent exoDNAse (exonuclease V) alpha subunit